jgi:enoyl-[acyl-carrier protein] reductase / trans-2-enoyl-CoA reductase (NAD+)
MVNAHPAGAAATVARIWDELPTIHPGGRRPMVLVVGSSAGYGLAAVLAAVRRGARGVGVALEAPETARRTASAGWYRTAAMAELAHGWTFLNTDAFGDAAKQDVAKLLADTYGQVDFLIYSIAAPRRTDPATGATHHSVIKPLGGDYTAKTLEFTADGAAIGSSTLAAATDEERDATVQVMGGSDWQLWIDALGQAGLLSDGFTTAALTYVGPDLTAAIYREGTIGAAKKHLEATARHLDARLGDRGRAFTVGAGAAVTQASTAIPSIALYTSILHRVLGGSFQSTARQMTTLWAQLTGGQQLTADEAGRIRLDDWELDPAVQDQVRAAWSNITTESATLAADTDWFREQIGWLYGWQVPGVDYETATETTVPWPTG